MNKYDQALRYEIFTNKEYSFADDKISQAKLIFDVGAHKGYFSEYCITLNPNVVIHAFEPVSSPELFIPNVIWNKQAIWIHSWTTDFWTNDQKSMQSSFFTNTFLNPHGSKVQVDVTSISEYLETHHISHIDLLKMDIEWAEYEVLENMDDQIWSRIDSIIVEYHQITPELKIRHIDLEQRLANIFPHFSVLSNPYSKDLGYWRGRR